MCDYQYHLYVLVPFSFSVVCLCNYWNQLYVLVPFSFSVTCLYVQLDETLIPLELKGPTATPPIKGYSAPDGEYIDTTKTFD